MDDAGGVRFGQRVRRLYPDVHHFAGKERRFPDPFGQALAVHVLHDDEDTAVFFAYFVDRADIGVIERGGGLRLVDEPFPCLGIAVPLLGQHLDRHLTPEGVVFGEEDLSHAARAELPNDSVMADR